MADEGQGTTIDLPPIEVYPPGQEPPPPPPGQGSGGPGATPNSDGLSDHGPDGTQLHRSQPRKGPLPTSANPAPPIGLRASHKGKVIAVTPDVKYVGARGQNPTPFITRGYTDDQEHYSPNVFYEGDNAMRFNSDITKTYGGQAGTGRGINSDTYMDRAFPQTHSDNVFVNGSPAMRKGDLFYHNGSGPDKANTIGKAQHPGPTDAKPAPKPSFWTRVWGGARVVGGVIEGVGAAAVFTGGTAADATGVGAVAGVPAQIGAVAVGANALDNVQTGFREIWYGTPQETLGQQGAGAIASGLGASQDTIEATKEATGLIQGGVGGGGGAVSEASTIGRDLSEANRLDKLVRDAKEAREAREAEQATEDGAGGVRVAKKRFKNPCKHLAKGDAEGKGNYRGGSYSGAPGSLENDLESHHTPADSAYDTLPSGQKPAVQMDTEDHQLTASHGWMGSDGADYRQQQSDLIASGNNRAATAMDVQDVRQIARAQGDPRKYNQALLEMLKYRKCLEENGLI